jgi:2-polyprenyl-3-methyl-5-hydroxy-6-metoxy-1,4-benzoquinol methylase
MPRSTLKLSQKGKELLRMYKTMVKEGYDTRSNHRIKSTYNDFEVVKFKEAVLKAFRHSGITSVLDYGSGGSDWQNQMLFDGQSAKAYFQVKTVKRFEPARDLDERGLVDAVVCFDVLEHVFVSDVPNVLRDIFQYAQKLVVINVACYEANALLPNGENAHVTNRHPMWWKGVVDVIATEFPTVEVYLLCSTAYNSAEAFPIFSDVKRHTETNYEINY